MTDDFMLPVHTDARGLDIDEAVGFYERVYTSRDIHIDRPDQDEFSWRYRAVGDDQLVIATSAVAARRFGTINPDRQYILAWATGPGITLDTGSRTPLLMQPGVPVMYPAGWEFTFEALPTTQHLLRFDGVFLEAVAAAQHRVMPGPLEMLPAVDPDRLRRLRQIVTVAAPQLLDPRTSRMVRTAVNMQVAEAVVTTFTTLPTVEVALANGPATMRLAQEWMVAHADRPITVTDVSVAVGIAVRSVQASFQKHAGISPMAFLRQVRLHRVHAELLAADATATPIADVARRWGFNHLGRFAASYATAFGELPSATLRRTNPVA